MKLHSRLTLPVSRDNSKYYAFSFTVRYFGGLFFRTRTPEAVRS